MLEDRILHSPASVTASPTSASRDAESNSYPAVLQHLLGEKFEVKNFGVSGRDVAEERRQTYWKENAFRMRPTSSLTSLSSSSAPTTRSRRTGRITCPGSPPTWAAMVDHFAALDSKPKIYLCLPAPFTKTQWGINEESVANEVIPAIRKVAAEKNSQSSTSTPRSRQTGMFRTTFTRCRWREADGRDCVAAIQIIALHKFYESRASTLLSDDCESCGARNCHCVLSLFSSAGCSPESRTPDPGIRQSPTRWMGRKPACLSSLLH